MSGAAGVLHGELIAHPGELQAGSFVGTYRILRTVCLGSTWHVYEAKSGSTQRQVALKILAHPTASAAALVAGRAEVLCQLAHPHVARVFAAGRESGLIFIAEEFIQGPCGRILDLEQEVADHGNRLPDERVRLLAAHLFSAFHYLHHFRGASLVHGRFDCSRVLFTEQRRVKLVGAHVAEISGASGGLGPADDVHALGQVLNGLLTERGSRAPIDNGSAGGVSSDWALILSSLASCSASCPVDLDALRERVLTLGEHRVRRRVWRSLLLVLSLVLILAAAAWGVRQQRVRQARREDEALAAAAASREAQVGRFLAFAEGALAKGNYGGASEAVQQVLAVSPGDARALRLQADITAASGLARLGPVKSAAERGWAEVRDYEGGQGMGERIAAVSEQLLQARTALVEMRFDDAFTCYEEICAATRGLAERERLRRQAAVRRDQSGAARDAADAVNGAAHARVLWQDAEALQRRAGSAFEAGDFELAAATWDQAGDLYHRAARQAAVARRLRVSKDAYETYHAGIGAAAAAAMPAAVRERIDQVVREAEALSAGEKWEESATRWDQALAALREAVNAAGATLRREHVAAAVTRGRAHLAAGRFAAAREAFDEALGVEGVADRAGILALRQAAAQGQADAAEPGAVRDTTGNLVNNGDFSVGGDGAPLGWTPPDNLTVFWHDDPLNGKCIRIDTDVYREEWEEHRKQPQIPMTKTPTSGPRYNTVGGTTGVAVYSRPIPVETDACYLIEYDVKGQGEPFLYVKGYWKCAAEHIASQGEKIFFRPFADGPSFSLVAMGTSGEERRAPRPGDYIQSYRRRIVARFPPDGRGRWRRFRSVLRLERRHRAEVVLLELYAFWPPGDYFFDNVSMRRVSSEFADQYEAERKALGEAANFGIPLPQED